MELTSEAPIHLTVHAESYTSQYRKISRNLYSFHRQQKWSPGQSDVEAFGNFWSVALADFPADELYMLRKDQQVPIIGKKAIFLPPHSIVEWQIHVPSFEWSALVSDASLPIGLPQQPTLYPWPDDFIPKSAGELISQLQNSQNFRNVAKLEQGSTLATKVKEFIDDNFMAKVSISEVAEELGYAHATVTRAFKKAYGLTPIAYRNKKRIFDSLCLMLFYDQPVNHAARAVGYEEVSQYNKQFRKLLRTTPSQYCH